MFAQLSALSVARIWAAPPNDGDGKLRVLENPSDGSCEKPETQVGPFAMESAFARPNQESDAP